MAENRGGGMTARANRWWRAARANPGRGAHRADGLAGPPGRYLLIVGMLAGTASLPILTAIGGSPVADAGLGDRAPFITPPSTDPMVVVPSPPPPLAPEVDFESVTARGGLRLAKSPGISADTVGGGAASDPGADGGTDGDAASRPPQRPTLPVAPDPSATRGPRLPAVPPPALGPPWAQPPVGQVGPPQRGESSGAGKQRAVRRPAVGKHRAPRS